jgi:uncharacterized lipoprotein YajG
MINRKNHTAILLTTIVAIALMAGCTGNGGIWITSSDSGLNSNRVGGFDHPDRTEYGI